MSRVSVNDDSLRNLHPAYFALVMATGIVSIAAWSMRMPTLGGILFGLNVLFYLFLWVLNILRIVRFPRRVKADFLNHGRCVGFFTVVAATCVLGSQVWLEYGDRRLATACWIFGILLWAGLTYTIFTLLTVKSVKPTLADGIDGGWLVMVVAAQSVSVLGAQLAPGFGSAQQPVLLFCLCMWLGAGMLYIWFISLIVYRYTFFPLHPSDLAPPYWINMGAVAISTLAGTQLVAASSGSPVLRETLPFLKGFTLFFWSTSTWWIPMLVTLGIWRHLYRHFPLRYNPLYWGAVFPLGMYTVCTEQLARVIDAPYLMLIPRIFVHVAIFAWGLTALGLLLTLTARHKHHLRRVIRRSRP